MYIAPDETGLLYISATSFRLATNHAPQQAARRHGASLLLPPPPLSPPLLLRHRAQAQRLPAVLPLRRRHVGLPGTGRAAPAVAKLSKLALNARVHVVCNSP